MAENDEIESTPALCTSDVRNTEPQFDHNSHGLSAVVRNNPPPLSAAELELGDDRESLSPFETNVTPGSIIPTEDTGGTDPDVTSDTCLLPTNIGVRIFLREIERLTKRVGVVETVVEPLKRYDGAVAGASSESTRQEPKENVIHKHIPRDGGMTHEVEQSIKESAELIRTINDNFGRLGEKLNEWVPVVNKKV